MALKNSYKEFDNEKKFLRLENSLPTITFLMVRPLSSAKTTDSKCTVKKIRCYRERYGRGDERIELLDNNFSITCLNEKKTYQSE